MRPKTFEESIREDNARKPVKSFGDSKFRQSGLKVEEILSRFKFIGLTRAFKKFQSNDSLLDFEEAAVKNFANKFTSVCLSPSVVREKVVDIVSKINQHKHTKACRKYQSSCRFSFPKYPV